MCWDGFPVRQSLVRPKTSSTEWINRSLVSFWTFFWFLVVRYSVLLYLFLTIKDSDKKKVFDVQNNTKRESKREKKRACFLSILLSLLVLFCTAFVCVSHALVRPVFRWFVLCRWIWCNSLVSFSREHPSPPRSWHQDFVSKKHRLVWLRSHLVVHGRQNCP